MFVGGGGGVERIGDAEEVDIVWLREPGCGQGLGGGCTEHSDGIHKNTVP